MCWEVQWEIVSARPKIVAGSLIKHKRVCVSSSELPNSLLSVWNLKRKFVIPFIFFQDFGKRSRPHFIFNCRFLLWAAGNMEAPHSSSNSLREVAKNLAPSTSSKVLRYVKYTLGWLLQCVGCIETKYANHLKSKVSSYTSEGLLKMPFGGHWRVEARIPSIALKSLESSYVWWMQWQFTVEPKTHLISAVMNWGGSCPSLKICLLEYCPTCTVR